MEARAALYKAALFCLLFVATNFVNKYVLSVLRFTYPTIFQGWQTLVGACVLKLLMVSGRLEPMLVGMERKDFALWVPGLMLFLVSIYSGSRALANLSVAVFFSLQNAVVIFKVITQLILHKQMLSWWSYIMVMAVVLSALGVTVTDPQMSVHVLCSGIYDFYFLCCDLLKIFSGGVASGFYAYTNLMTGRLKLNTLDRLYSCYLYSVVMLAPSSFLLGDAWAAVSYPYLYFTKFYIGCFLSGVLGVYLNITAIDLQESNVISSSLDFSAMQGIARIFGTLLSFLIFNTVLTANFAFLVAVNHLCNVVVSDVVIRFPLPHVVNTSERTIKTRRHVSAPDIRQLERHELQRDMLRIELG